MIDRRTFLGALTGSVVAAPFAVDAQPTRNTPTIGFLGPSPSIGGMVQAFQQGLLDLGYVEGRNIHIEYRYNAAIQGNLDRLAELAAELVKLAADLSARGRGGPVVVGRDFICKSRLASVVSRKFVNAVIPAKSAQRTRAGIHFVVKAPGFPMARE